MTDWRDLTLESIPGWPLRYQLVACLGGLGMLSLVFWHWSIKAVIQQEYELQEQARSLRTQLAWQRTQAELLPEWSARTDKMMALYRQQSARLPDKSAWPQVLAEIEILSVDADVALQHLRWGKSENHQWYSVQPLHFEWRGDYDSSGTLLAGLASMRWLLVVNELTMQSVDGQSTELRVTGSAHLYQIPEPSGDTILTDEQRLEMHQ
ncbi:type 4a pilus biogenesis protein PilO [Photobacterium sp. WH77]|uniref:type 4a pilus biogenesis protein PilO n=1 Tax=unclassified Photobacterium TaxID=2628852 RepID=UPI001EDAB579|nr:MULTISPECIES: type 4a pilus biogenesis protein PilO [unclassified Photobacterium]MCG2837060.1 type 4a pilus biogenesis protein PilO [Photobacterium sp. WH77]MCG2844790.1 type 4a pilus biogenesis protein PilO [Photobacterium sp. WH80]